MAGILKKEQKYAEPNGTEVNSPVTGDYSQPVLWMILQLLSIVMVGMFLRKTNIFKKNKYI